MGKYSARVLEPSLYVTLSLQPHTELSVGETLGEALYTGCEIQKPAAMLQKHRYDLNDLYAVFLEYWDSADSQPQRGLIVLCAFCKGFPDTHTYSNVGA